MNGRYCFMMVWKEIRYSSPDKVGPIEMEQRVLKAVLSQVKFPQQRLLRDCARMLFSQLRLLQTLFHINQPKVTTSIWHKVCVFSFIIFTYISGSGFDSAFSGFDSVFGVFRNSVSNSVKAWYRACVDSKPLMILAYRPRNPGVSHSKCQSFMDTWTFLGFCRRKNFFLGALPISRLFNQYL